MRLSDTESLIFIIIMNEIELARRGCIPPKELTNEYIQKYDLHPVVAEILAARVEKDKADSYLNPLICQMHKADAFNDMVVAVNLIKQAVLSDKHIYICGDYDVDGICGTTILYRTLKSKTKKVHVAIPEREKEGYGINSDVIDRLAELGGGILLTVDCGISENEKVEYAKKKGLTVIVTDHHTCPENLPCADAIINPKMPGEKYPDKNLCGAGVAFKLACALIGKEAFEYIDFAAIATIADMVPMVGENRIISNKGLVKINDSKSVDMSIKVLIDELNLTGKVIDSDRVSFVIAPRINAAGRVGEADVAFKFFCGDENGNKQSLKKMASYLCSRNQQRQDLQQKIINDIQHKIDVNTENANIYFNEDWPIGVLGLAASWASQRSCKPTILLTEKDGLLTGSARSIDGIDIFNILKQCEKYLVKFGGHSQAAGLTIDPVDDGFARFKTAFLEIINNSALFPKSKFKMYKYYDICCRVDDINDKFINDVEKLSPFGVGNPSVKVLFENVIIRDMKYFSDGAHARFDVVQEGSAIHAVLFGVKDSKIIYENKPCTVLASVSRNYYSGCRELVVDTVHFV